MDLIQKILNIEERSYSSNLNQESLKKKIEDLFEKSTINVEGKLTSENEFTAYDKMPVIGWETPNLKRKAAYLKGKITLGEKGTLVNLKVKPNSALPIFSILITVLGVVFTLIALSMTEGTFLLIIGIVFIALGIIYYPLSTFFKNRLRNKVVKYLDLEKLHFA